ncbi:MAG TPA: hypothetical protein PKC28_00615 [Bdellovibrionales bacterium]|nr:hypothetical protein [Bdellovibrionales bacterium]
MFLRIALATLVVSATAHASVNEEQAMGIVRQGVIETVDPRGEEIFVEIRARNAVDREIVERHRLCSARDLPEVEKFSSDEMRAAHHILRVQALNDLARAQKTVAFSERGPWSPCLSRVIATGS